MDQTLSLTVNGKAVTATIDPRTTLVQFLREHLRLTGTHVGCDTAQCGACTVHMNGRAVKSCSMLALQVQGSEIRTIESLAGKDGEHLPALSRLRPRTLARLFAAQLRPDAGSARRQLRDAARPEERALSPLRGTGARRGLLRLSQLRGLKAGRPGRARAM